MSNSPLVLPPILIPRAAQRSKSRDNTAAFIWDRAIYYFSVFFPLVASIVVFQIFFVNESTASLSSTLGKLIFASKFIWLGSLLISVTNIIGLMRYGSPMQTDVENLREFKRTKWNKSKQLIVVYVSRGDNHEALGRALKHSLKVLDEFEVNYRVDIVTDIPVSQRLEKFLHSRFHVVPHSYFTSRYAKYKARALHYLVEHRSKFTSEVSFKDTWLLHLDEESLITPECLAGIAKFIKNPRNFQAIGQGEIKYNSHDYGKNLLLTAVDSVRTGDDLGRFRFQYKWLERPIFGMHGSYILVPESIEKSLGFDLGGRGSITETPILRCMHLSVDINFAGLKDLFVSNRLSLSQPSFDSAGVGIVDYHY